jgi:nicotinate-nucleotide--dimethylbenzimidazole phosphoribosyltransferase
MTTLEETVQKIASQSSTGAGKEAKKRLDALCMPHWALGRLMDLALDLAEMTGMTVPKVQRKTVVVMAGDHGVVNEGTSLYPREVTQQMVRGFVSGRAGINVLARQAKARVAVVDMGVDGDFDDLVQSEEIISAKIARCTGNITSGPAMSRQQAASAVETGIRVALELADKTDVYGTGDMGIGNTTPSSAIVALFCGASPAEVTGRGTGIGDEQLKRKVEIVERALAVNKPDPSDGLDVLAKVGGFEIGGIAGLILGAASLRKPVLVDGFISTAGALVAQSLCPQATRFMIAAHKSVEQGHLIALDFLGLRPLLDLDLRLGEGTGAALAMPLMDAAVKVLTEMATFEEAAVSKAN